MRRLLLVLYLVLCVAFGFVLAPAVDYSIAHLKYHYHGGWEGMEVRHSRSIPCEEAETWAKVTQRIWGDILKGNSPLEGYSFTFSVVEYGELGPFVDGDFTTKRFWWRSETAETVSVALPWSNGESLEEVSIVKTIAHELAHLRRYLEQGSQEGCYLTSTSSSQWNLEDYLDNPCERAAREFAARYMEEHPEFLEELLEDSG
ncbi:hypothetical protein COT70_02280 [candidate division WWE3 bacterium CG09_land_8_20_14_0_10_47_33]|uniref:Peptidase MA-like domain-containing protein n=1 Tax=candidate division WWE3 bacterium CG_4_9_14_0_2_um_filter_48_10 TaxID=1975078 RepID=A0A2M8EK27_UNCKA|nr:MAG: hypothetical protein COT70_02280 [candidate division WWE3 bacterium CG09_land_8_20_14_0_10_47_33]PIZ41596.1 MAG: hypothetical protein COY35_00020 [candidate division WWE3 bacterium CG_4_10_14_0_2_um_filter_47_8]PJC23101.1 MAG: hypothetical protein CO059_00640 [candidate division WWE3 bacterium CG_4_9_14_0_2_um_filter_48_10]PJE51944.1 MAG: hypothetical protein COV28_01365 [candidate division WWE3 bacterium CG10_big_fil_rev_8_21_14_0_10_48_23]